MGKKGLQGLLGVEEAMEELTDLLRAIDHVTSLLILSAKGCEYLEDFTFERLDPKETLQIVCSVEVTLNEFIIPGLGEIRNRIDILELNLNLPLKKQEPQATGK